MKTWKLISMLLLAFMVGACDDDPAVEEGNGGGSGSGSSDQVSASWGIESKTVLKNAGQVLVPVKLSNPTGKAVKVTVAAQQSDDAAIAREGIDFDLPEKVVTFPAGDTLAFLTVDLLDNGKVETDRTVVLNITGVYDGQVAAAKTCSLYIVNNAFVEFQYKNRETYEAAGTYKIPVLVTGELREATTFTVRVKEGGTALEGTHFVLPQTVFTLEPGATSAEVEIELIDDTEANEDRWFDLEIVSVTGSNATVGKSVSLCRVTIISEEVLKSVSFGAAEFSVEEGQTLQIPVRLDKAPAAGEADVEVTFSVKVANSTAIEGEDFTIEEKTLRFVPGQMENELVIKTIDNDLIDANKIVELSFRAAVGANIGIPDICRVTILNNDLPAFEQGTYEIEEDLGDLVLPVELPAVQPTDAHLIVKVIAGEAAKEGKHYTLTTSEVVIPAGETKGEVHINIGHDLEWTSTPEFKVYLAGSADGNIVWDETVCASVIKLKQCNYRKFLGTWRMSSSNPEAMKADCDIVVSAGVNGEDFNKRYVCNTEAGAFSSNTGAALEWHMDYDKTTGAIRLVMGERINVGGNLNLNGISVYLTWFYFNDQNTKYVETSWDGDDTLLLHSGGNYVCLAYIGVDDNSWAGQAAWHLNNVKMIRQ